MEKLVGQVVDTHDGWPPSAPGGTVIVTPPAVSVPPLLSMVALLVDAVRHTLGFCEAFATDGQLSQSSPTLSPSLSRWSRFTTAGQLSITSGTWSPSASGAPPSTAPRSQRAPWGRGTPR